MKKQGMSARGITINALLLALSIVLLFLASFVPAVEMSLYALVSFCVAAAIIEGGLGRGFLLYVAAMILPLILLPDKLAILPYAIFFGPYPCVKYIVEKLRKQVLEILLKLLCFNVFLGIGILFFKALFMGPINLTGIPWWILLAAVQAVFLLYDYVMTLAIGFYNNRIHRRI